MRDEVSGIGESRGKGKDKSSAAGIGDEERTRTSGREERIDGEREREMGREPRTAVRLCVYSKVRVDSALCSPRFCSAVNRPISA